MKKCITKILAVLMTVAILTSLVTLSAGAQISIANKNKRNAASHPYIEAFYGFISDTVSNVKGIAIEQNIKTSSDYYIVDKTKKSGSSYEADVHYGTGKYIADFGLSFTTDSTQAITYIYATIGENIHTEAFTKDVNSTSVTMDLVGGFVKLRDVLSGEYSTKLFSEINLNEGYDDETEIYLYTSKNSALGSPITQIFLDIRTDALTDYTGTDKTYVRDQNGAIADLNYGASNHVYMYYLTTSYEPLAGSVFADSGIIYTIIGAVIFAGAITGVIIITKKKN